MATQSDKTYADVHTKIADRLFTTICVARNCESNTDVHCVCEERAIYMDASIDGGRCEAQDFRTEIQHTCSS